MNLYTQLYVVYFETRTTPRTERSLLVDMY